jgi:23S rRNA pseudouridine1911/1915/1917 synthase
LKIVLETGRYHQIRCQCAAMGHPILGDVRYGASKRGLGPQLPSGTIALHHAQLTLQHPVTKEQLCIEAPLTMWGLV